MKQYSNGIACDTADTENRLKQNDMDKRESEASQRLILGMNQVIQLAFALAGLRRPGVPLK